jgi:hypothetical protein
MVWNRLFFLWVSLFSMASFFAVPGSIPANENTIRNPGEKPPSHLFFLPTGFGVEENKTKISSQEIFGLTTRVNIAGGLNFIGAGYFLPVPGAPIGLLGSLNYNIRISRKSAVSVGVMAPLFVHFHDRSLWVSPVGVVPYAIFSADSKRYMQNLGIGGLISPDTLTGEAALTPVLVPGGIVRLTSHVHLLYEVWIIPSWGRYLNINTLPMAGIRLTWKRIDIDLGAVAAFNLQISSYYNGIIRISEFQGLKLERVMALPLVSVTLKLGPIEYAWKPEKEEA